MAKEKPIMFSGPMVRAILAGTKTQTRRVVNPKSRSGFCYQENINSIELVDGKWVAYWGEHEGADVQIPNYRVGYRLWVRETWCEYGKGKIIYRADYGNHTPLDDGIGGPWKSPLFMRREHSRLTLEVTEVRCQRVHSITDADVRAEGVEPIQIDKWRKFLDPRDVHGQAFGELWDSINGKKHPWSTNPWVWVYTFRKVTDAQS